MNDYISCSEEEFTEAMSLMHRVEIGNIKPETLPVGQLFIMYTKMQADCAKVNAKGSKEPEDVRAEYQRIVKLLEKELASRGVLPAEKPGKSRTLEEVRNA